MAFVLTGCGSGSSTGSGGGGSSNPQASLSASSLTFTATPGQTAAAQTVTLANTGSATLTVASITVTGTNATNFPVTNTCGSALAANSSCTISTTFAPPTAASYSATITITDNSGGASSATQTITLNGTGAAPLATLSSTSLSFPTTLVGTTSASQSVTVTNGGTVALSITSITPGGTSPSAFTVSNTCGSSVAAGANCTISATFTPAAATTYGATITVTTNAATSPQTITLSGSGSASQVNLSATSVTFSTTFAGSTTPAQTVTMTNTGNATLNISGIALGGTNPAQFAKTTTCGATLAANASCSISATFTPAAATTYSATITITDDAKNSPQTITLSGTGSSSTVSHQLYAFPETDNSVTPLYTLINATQHTLDMTMYALEDTTFTNDLVSLCGKGVVVRVVLDQNLEKSGNTSAYNTLNAHTNCSAVWANKAFQATHQKTFILDGTQVAIMSLNLQSQYYSTTRDFAMIENDPVDIAAIQATFNADYAAGTPSSGVAGTSDFSYTPGPGTDLIWSPTTAQAAMTNIIANAKSTLIIENEEMASSASYIISALQTACGKGIQVHIAMVDQTTYESNFTLLKNAGCSVHTVPNTSNQFYIHAKAVIADYGLGTQSVYMGSINYSNASMTQNRELGMYIADTPSISLLYTTMVADYNRGTAW
ncbi:MAG: choice-of-anchor D domain-containing protein [Acidobacteriota bacterium]